MTDFAKENDKKKRSNLMKLLVEYKETSDEERKAFLKGRLREELYILSYAYAHTSPYIGAEDASLFVIDVEKEFDKLIDGFKVVDKVDFTFYVKKALRIRELVFYRSKSAALKKEKAMLNIVKATTSLSDEEDYSSENLSKNSALLYEQEYRDWELVWLFNKKNVQNYLLSKSLVMSEEVLQKILLYLSPESRASFLENYHQILSMYKERTEESKDRDKMNRYLIRKRQAEMDGESYERVEYYDALKKQAEKNVKKRFKLSYKELLFIDNIGEVGLGRSIREGRNAIIKYMNKHQNKEATI